MRILLVDDDTIFVEIIKKHLEGNSYSIDAVMNGEQGWIYGTNYPYDLAIIDLKLPDIDGIHLCRRFREGGYKMPIMLLTARDTSVDKVKGLDAGADDYVIKTVDAEEFLARVRALLRRPPKPLDTVFRWGELCLDSCDREVTYKGNEIALTAKEYGLLTLFLRHNQQVFSLEAIIDCLWSSTEFPAAATVRSHLRGLRQKLKKAGAPIDFIETVHGLGYRLKPPGVEVTDRDSGFASDSDKARSLQPVDRDEALTKIWLKYRSKTQNHLLSLERVADCWRQQTLTATDVRQARLAAHSLAGLLGVFGRSEGSRLAKSLEQMLEKASQSSIHWLEFADRTAVLKQIVMDRIATEKPATPDPDTSSKQTVPVLLLVNCPNHLIQHLEAQATQQGLKTAIAPNPAAAQTWLQATCVERTFPIAILLNLPYDQANCHNATLLDSYLDLMEEVNATYPYISVVVLAERDGFDARREAAGQGAKLVLRKSLSPNEIFDGALAVLKQPQVNASIVVVDDDPQQLQFIADLLQSCHGLTVTTLDNPLQFWDVLQTEGPDLVILDVEMPNVSGIELCKVIRSHPHWRRLPVLFLTVHSDPETQRQVFDVGADDYVNKLMATETLVPCMLNRLQRVHLYDRSPRGYL